VLISFAKSNTGTGILGFLDCRSKEFISNISLVEPNEEIMKTYKTVLVKALNPTDGQVGMLVALAVYSEYLILISIKFACSIIF